MRSIFALIALLTLLGTPHAQAVGNPEPPQRPTPGVQDQIQAQTQGQAQNASQRVTQSQENTTNSTSDASSVSNSTSNSGDSSSNTHISYSEPRQAPPVYVPSLNNTALGLKCFGFGGSFAEDGTAGGGAVGWCWLARDAFALQRYHQYAQENKPEQAANAYCEKPLLRGAYKEPGMARRDVVAACERDREELVRQYWAENRDAAVVPDPQMPASAPCTDSSMQLSRCESMLKGVK